ncbi:TIGR02444 family protein [Roseibium sp. Sym1]|uniref:TIGR02444 family protein n=1 Tax=Roseibium sp. Sym1 TaxID=3016006 RepID=UPI003FA748FE
MRTLRKDAKIDDFIGKIYFHDSLEHGLVEIQEKYHINVVFLLFVAWLCHHGRGASAREIAMLWRKCAPWCAEVIRPLQAVRRRLASGPAPAPGGDAESLRQSVKASELDAELILLDYLQAELSLSVTGCSLDLRSALRTGFACCAASDPPEDAERVLSAIESAVAGSSSSMS